jgi:maltooligosyltrehalose trehalohydrolase
MLFMGEEWGARTPFLFFCDFGPELARAVTEGRRGEFARFAAFASPAARAAIPDPNARATFERSRLDWAERESGAGRARLALVSQLLGLRREHLAPRLAGAKSGRYAVNGELLRVAWPLGDGARIHLAANFGESRGARDAPGRTLYALRTQAPSHLPRGAVRWSLETP